MGYHLREIERGVFGESSKVREETEEFLEALEQNNRLMALLELSDLIGAIEGYAEKNGSSLTELLVMKDATRRAFNGGTRGPRAETAHTPDFDQLDSDRGTSQTETPRTGKVFEHLDFRD